MKTDKINTAAAKAILDQKTLIPGCGEEYDISITNTISVANCHDFTDAEQESMMKGVLRKWKNEAETICEELGSCPYPALISMDVKSSECEDKLWTVVAIIKSKCEQ